MNAGERPRSAHPHSARRAGTARNVVKELSSVSFSTEHASRGTMLPAEMSSPHRDSILLQFPEHCQKLCPLLKNATIDDLKKFWANTSSSHVRWFHDPEWCADGLETRWECSPTRFRVRHPYPSATPCEILRKTGTKRILFVGESTTRLAFWGLLLLLTRDYLAIRPGGFPADCEWADELYLAQRNCRHELTHVRNAQACEGNVSLTFHEVGVPPTIPAMQDLKKWDVVVWLWQGHPASADWIRRPGVNDASVISRMLQPRCKDTAYQKELRQRMILLDLHPRMGWTLSRSRGECPDNVAKYRRELPAVWQAACGVTHVASAWDETVGLIATDGTGWNAYEGHASSSTGGTTLRSARNESLTLGAARNESLAQSQWRKMTLDQGAHWGTAINVLKAWSVLIEIESLRNRSNDEPW